MTFLQQKSIQKSDLVKQDFYLQASHKDFVKERPVDAEEDVHMLSSIADYAINTFTNPEDIVFDPFLGFGTTALRSVALGRKAFGIELLPERVDRLKELLPEAALFEGDAREMLRILLDNIPTIISQGVQLVLASPPYMTVNDHEADPLTAYELNNGEYHRYLAELELIVAQCARLVALGGYVVWNVADISYKGEITPLIDDCKQILAKYLTPVDVTEIRWDRYPHDLVADALLVFRRDQLA